MSSPSRLNPRPGHPLRVLHLTGDHHDSGGILSVIRALHEESVGGSCEHVLLVNPAFRQRRAPVVPVLELPGFWGDGVAQLRLLAGALRSLRGLRELLARQFFHVLHAHTRGGYLLGLLHASTRPSPPVLFTNHTYGRQQWLYRLGLRLPQFQTVLLTPNMGRHYRIPPGHPRVSVVSECFRSSFLERPLVPARLGGSGPIHFVGVGNVVLWKKWQLLVDALARLPADMRNRIRFHHYGPVLDHPESRDLMARLLQRVEACQLENVVEFCGPTNDVAGQVAAADWFVLPSTNEPCSVALLEALALGRPALVSRSGGNVDIVQEGTTGLFFAPDNVESLAEGLSKIISKQVVVSTSLEIRKTVEERSGSAIFKQYEKLYYKLNCQG